MNSGALIALQFIALYVVVGFVPIVCARLFAGTRGARQAAHLVFVRAPTWLVVNTFWLAADCVLAFTPHGSFRPQPLDEQFMTSQKEPPATDNSLLGKLERMKREQMALIMQLTAGQLHEVNLTRAFEFGLIDHIAIRHDHGASSGSDGNGGPFDSSSSTTSISLVIRTPRVFDQDMPSGANDGRS